MGAQGSHGREVRWRFLRRYITVTFPLGVLITVFYGLWIPVMPNTARLGIIAGNAVLFVVFGSAFLVVFGIWLDRRLRDLAWLEEDRAATFEEASSLRALPRRIGRFVLVFQLAVAAVTSVLNYVGNRIVLEGVRVAVGLSLGALTFAALGYLVAEASLRSEFARTFAGVTKATRSNIGVRDRLLLAWALGSGIPLLFILAIPIGRDEPGRIPPSPFLPMMFMAITGLIVGATTTTAVARSISDPLASVRAGLQRVRGGDLDALVAVDDPGEVGLLQSGFNDMVEGLRERRVLEDLFGRHVGEEVARRAVRDGVELGGELREASVLMIDVIGSTALARRMPPQEVVTLLNSFFAVVVNTVDAHGGWVNKFEGDAALCVFGVPDHVPDHSARALNAAVELAVNLEALFGARGELQAGVGVSGGAVLAGNVGAARRLEYTVIGDPVNEAARLADFAKTIPGRTVASETVIAMAAQPSSWRHDRDVLLRGRDVETRVYVPATNTEPSVGLADTPTP